MTHAVLMALAQFGVVACVSDPEPFVVRLRPSTPGAIEAGLEACREHRVKNPRGEAVIELAEGRYQLTGTIHLTAKDSGTIIRGAPGARPVISGGAIVRGWTRDAARPGEWSAPMLDPGSRFHQLFVDGARATLAREPDVGFFAAAGPLGAGSPITLPSRAGDIDPALALAPGARVVMLQKWTDLHVPIAEFDKDSGVLTLPGGPRPFWMDEPDARYWIEGVPGALDTPGEWCIDRAAGRVRFIAPGGVDPDSAEVVSPRLRTLLLVEGAPDNPVVGVRITGVTFSDADFEVPEQGMMSPQAAVPVRGAVRATHAHGLVIEECELRNLGGYAIDLGRGVQGARIIGNIVSSIGAGGVRIGEPDDRHPAPADECRDNVVSDNTMTALGRVFAPACGVIIFQSSHNRVAHNHISDLYYTGISVGWTWGYTESPCHHNIIEHNLVERVGQKRLSDMGGIYTLGPQPGTVIRNNVFLDVQSYRYGGWGLYTDEGSTGIVIENNVAARCTDAGFHQHYGRDNLVRNNLLAFNERHGVMRTRDEEHLSFRFTGNVIIQNSGSILGSNWNAGPERFVSDGNLWFDTRLGDNGAAYVFGPGDWAAWNARGHDVHSRIADPMLVDPARPELGLRPGSPAFDLGFQQIDVRSVGPRPPGLRDARP